MATQAAPARRAWWRFPGWWTVLAGGIQGFMGYGIILYAWSAFVRALISEFKWTTTDMGAVASLARLLGMGFNPLGGIMTDRIGPRFNGLLWMIIGALGIVGLASISQLWMVFALYSVVLYGVMNAGLYRVSWVAANRWFIRQRAAAMGWIAVGTGIGSTILVPFSGFLIGAYGWRMAAIILGVIWAVVCIPLCFLYLTRMPEHYGLRPDNEPAEGGAARPAGAPAAPAARPSLVDFSVRQSMGTAAFWFIALANSFSFMGGALLPVFQNVRMEALGFSIEEAAFFYGLNFAFTVVGRGSISIFGDWLSSRLSPRIVLSICYLGEAVGILLFAFAFNAWFIWGWVVVYGIAYGASIPYWGYLMGAYFGRANYGAIIGIQSGIGNATGSIAPIFVGWLRDVTADWVMSFLVGAAAYALAGVAIVFAVIPKTQAKD